MRTNDKQRYALAQLEDGQWYIRANQGHTLKVDNEQLLERLTTPLPVVVHGTSLANWENIKREGLKKMQRHHVHCATGLPGDSGVISGKSYVVLIHTHILLYVCIHRTLGMRKTSEVFIYIDMAKALQGIYHVILFIVLYGKLTKSYIEGMTFYRSKNQVILTEGKNGIVSPEYFSRVTDCHGNSLL